MLSLDFGPYLPASVMAICTPYELDLANMVSGNTAFFFAINCCSIELPIVV